MPFKIKYRDRDQLDPESVSVSSSFVFRLKKEVAKGAEREFYRLAKVKSVGAVKRAQNGAHRAVFQKLLEGFPNPRTGGAQNVRYKGPFGTRSFRTPSWKALRPSYANATPVSEVFWRKHPVGVGAYQHGGQTRYTLHSLFKKSMLTDTRASTSDFEVKETQKGRKKGSFLASWTINFNLPGLVLTQAVTEPMLVGLESKPGSRFPNENQNSWYTGMKSNRDLSLLVWVEGRRPFIRSLSFNIGQQLRRELRDQFEELASTPRTRRP